MTTLNIYLSVEGWYSNNLYIENPFVVIHPLHSREWNLQVNRKMSEDVTESRAKALLIEIAISFNFIVRSQTRAHTQTYTHLSKLNST